MLCIPRQLYSRKTQADMGREGVSLTIGRLRSTLALPRDKDCIVLLNSPSSAKKQFLLLYSCVTQ